MKHTRKKSNGMERHMLLLPVFLVAVVALILVAAAPQVWARGGKHRGKHHWNREKIDFAETAIFFEYNSTDRDLGLHIFFDAEGWKEVEVKNQYGEIFEVENGGGLRDIGSTEVFTESAEPPLCPEDEDECDVEEAIREFQEKFPEGEYKFRGMTVDGKRLKGEAMLMHALPAPPVITSPEEGDEAADIAVIEWTAGADDPAIVGYEVVAELVFEVGDEEKVYVNTATLPAGVTSFTVSEEFVRLAVRAETAGVLVELKAEVIAIAANGNKTITEVAVVEEE